MRTLLARASVWHSACMIIEHAHIDTDLKSYHGYMKQAKLHQSFYLPPALLFALASEYMLRHCRFAREKEKGCPVCQLADGPAMEVESPRSDQCSSRVRKKLSADGTECVVGHTVAMFMMLVASMSCR